jgi:hypothetical protein
VVGRRGGGIAPALTRALVSATRTDEAMQLAVLMHLLALHPTRLSRDELLREMCSEPSSFGERDACENAVRRLGRGGLAAARR